LILSLYLKLRKIYTLVKSLCREEIQRIKACNPDISHREAFSTAAKNVSLCLAFILFFLYSKLIGNNKKRHVARA
jgi:hypothetical protein